jgi:hypothetical protein
MLIIHTGLGQEVAPADNAAQAASMQESMAKLQLRMSVRLREEMMKQTAIQTGISLGLLAVPVIGWILSAIYTVISLPGSLYVKQRMASLVRSTQARIAAASERVQDEITAVQRRIQDEVFDQAVALAVSGDPIPGFSGLGGMFSKVTRKISNTAKKVTKSSVKYVKKVGAAAATVPKSFSLKALAKPDDALRAIGRVTQAISDPVFQPLEKPVGFVWRPITMAAAAVPAAMVWVSGQVVIRTTAGVMLAMGDTKGAARMDDSARKWDKYSRDKIWLRSAKTLQTANQLTSDMRKMGNYVIGMAGLDEIKEKLEQLEEQAYKMLAMKRADSLAQLATPQARQVILTTMADMMRQTPEGLAAMDAHARYLRALIYNKNNLLHPDQVTPEPSFTEAVAEGFAVVTGDDDPLATYGGSEPPAETFVDEAPPMDSVAVAGLASADMLAGMTVASLTNDRAALHAQLQALERAFADAEDVLAATPAGDAYSIAAAKLEAKRPQYERDKQKLESQISAINDQIAATQRDNASAVGRFLTGAFGVAKNVASAAVTRGAAEYANASAHLTEREALASRDAAAVELAQARALKPASKTPLVLGVAAAALAVYLITRKK